MVEDNSRTPQLLYRESKYFRMAVVATRRISEFRVIPGAPAFEINREGEVRRRLPAMPAKPSAKLTEQKVAAIRQKYATGKTTITRLAREYGVTFKNVSLIVNGKTWKTQSKPVYSVGYRVMGHHGRCGGKNGMVLLSQNGKVVVQTTRRELVRRVFGVTFDAQWRKGESSRLAKLTQAKVTEIRKRYAKGQSLSELAARFHVGVSNIYAIVSGRTWKHLLDGRK